MPDMEKVVNGLECCSKTDMCCMEISCYHPAYLECPYHEIEDGCIQAITKDALSLLKEQEAVKPKSKVRHGANAQIQHFCGNCNSMLHGKPKFCSECGRPVLWEGR